MGLFDTLNKNIGALGMPGGLGLMTTGLGLLEGESPLKAVQAGLGTYGSLNEEEERRRRKEAIAKLGQQYAGDPRLKAIIDADPDAGLSLIAQLEAQRRRPRTPTTLQQRQNLAEALGYAPDSAEYRRILETGSTAAAPITTAKDADGFLRNVATGERVFPDATGKPTTPKYREFDGDLYQETPDGLSLVKEGTDEIKFTTLGDKVYRQEGKNLVEVIDDSTPPAPVLREVNGTLYNVTDPKNPVEVIKGAKDPKTANIGGALYDITDIKNPTLIIDAPETAVTAKTQNYTAGKDFTLNGRTIKAGQTFALDLNNVEDVATALVDGEAIEAPTRTETTVTNTPANETAAKNILSDATGAAAKSAEADPTIDIVQAGGGDIGGVFTDALNTAAGFFGTTFNATREEQKAAVNAANNAIREPLVKALSRSGSVYTQKQIGQLLPSPSDGNEKFIQKAEALMPTLENEMKFQATVIATTTDAAEKQAAQNSLQELAKYTEGMKAAIKKYREDRPSGGVSDAQRRADEILRRSRD